MQCNNPGIHSAPRNVFLTALRAITMVMNLPRFSRLTLTALVTTLWTLSGCGGGGGGGGGSSTSTSTPTDTTTDDPYTPPPLARATASPASPYVITTGHNLFTRTHIDEVYTNGLGGETEGTAIAVLDDGVIVTGALATPGKVIRGRNFMSQSSLGRQPLYTNPGYTGDARYDTSGLQGGGIGPLGHGTSVAAIAAGFVDSSTGTGGIAYNARVLPVRLINDIAPNAVPNAIDFRSSADATATGDIYSAGELALLDIGGGSLSAIREGLLYVAKQPDSTVRVSNMSIYGDGFENQANAFAIARLAPQKVFVFAAGNRGRLGTRNLTNADDTTFGEDAGFNPAHNPGNVLVVGTVDGANNIDNLRAGNCRDFFLVAPGGATSWATPVVAASAYIIISNWPALTGAQVCQILLKTANKNAGGDLGNPALAGQGMLNMKAAMMPLGTVAVPVAVGLAPYTQTTAWLNTLLAALQARPVDFGAILTFDDYQRDFYVNLNTRMKMRSHTGASSFLHQVLHRVTRPSQQGVMNFSDRTGLALSYAGNAPQKRPGGSSCDTESFTSHGFMEISPQSRLGLTLGYVQPFAGWMPATSDHVLGTSDPTLWALFPQTFDSVYGSHTLNDRMQWGYQYVRTRPLSVRAQPFTKDEASPLNPHVQGFVAHASMKLGAQTVANMSIGRLEEQESWLGNQGSGALSLGSRHVSHFVHTKIRMPWGANHALTAYGTGLHTPGQSVTGSLIHRISETVALGYGLMSDHRVGDQGMVHLHAGVPLHVVQGHVFLALPRMVNRWTRQTTLETRDISLRSASREYTFEAGYEQSSRRYKTMAYGVASTLHLAPQRTHAKTEAGLVAYWKCTF